jgi:U4/U6.U5 tri-snRNP-associated protein 2
MKSGADETTVVFLTPILAFSARQSGPTTRKLNAHPAPPIPIMAAVSEPTSPPAAKRARLDPDTQFSTLPPSSPQSNGANGTTSSTPHAPVATSTPVIPDTTAPKKEKNEDYESDDEDVPEQPVAEDEDLTRRDMYLDTVGS